MKREPGYFMRFGVTGLLGTATFYLALYALVEWAGAGVYASTSLAFVLVIMQNYLLHYYWTFGSDKPHKASLPKFAVMSVVGFLINFLVMYGGVDLLGVNYLIVQGFAILAVVSWNFTLSMIWVF